MEQQIKVEDALTNAIKQLDKSLLRKAKVKTFLFSKFRSSVLVCDLTYSNQRHAKLTTLLLSKGGHVPM